MRILSVRPSFKAVQDAGFNCLQRARQLQRPLIAVVIDLANEAGWFGVPAVLGCAVRQLQT